MKDGEKQKMSDILLSVDYKFDVDLNSEVSKLVESVSAKAPPIKLDVKLDGEKVNKLKQEISSINNALNKSTTGTSSSSYMQGLANGAKAANSQLSATKLHINAVKAALKEINTTNNSITSAYKKLSTDLGGAVATGQNATDLDALREKYIELQNAVENLRSTKKSATQEDIEGIYRLQAEMQELINTTRKRFEVENSGTETTEKRIQVTNEYTRAINQMQKAVRDYSAAEHSNKSSDSYAGIKTQIDGLKDAFAAFDSGDITTDQLRQKIKEANSEFLKYTSTIKNNGDAHKTWGEQVGGLASKFSSWLTVSQLIMYAVNSIRKMVSASIELDTAMTELKKVTDETDTTYSHFLENAETRAKTIGSSLTDIVNATADFARLGYDIDEASELADVATIYNNVGDDVESISDASDSIIATMQAFGISADDAMSIVDKFNEVGKHIMPSNTAMCY